MLFHFILKDDHQVVLQTQCPVNPFSSKRGQWSSEGSISLRGLDLRLQLWDMRSSKGDPVTLNPSITPVNTGLLKSNLQKCVRRREVEKGLATAFVLFLKDPDEALRRWSIIQVEDGLPSSGLLPLTWLMCAKSKGYTLQGRDLEVFMVSVLECLTDDRCHELKHSAKDVVDPIHPRLFGKLNPVSQAMWIRSTYGGMKGDMIMLQNAAIKWEGEGYPKEVWSPKPIDLSTIPPFDTNCVLPAANDFHVNPDLLNPYLHGPYSYDQVKRAFWCHSSGVIHRTSIDGTERATHLKEGQVATKEVWKWIREIRTGETKSEIRTGETLKTSEM